MIFLAELAFKSDRLLGKDLSLNIKRLSSQKIHEKSSLSLSTIPTHTSVSTSESEWFARDSISALIINFLATKNIKYKYIEDLTFHENLLLALGSKEVYTNSTFEQILENARVHAFNVKYGNYNYEKDLRRKSTSWSQDIIKKIQEHFGRINNLSILNVGGNNGLEIDDIFKDKTGSSFTILDISDEALRNGQTLYPSFVFQQGNMEKDYLEDKQYDICLCLRTIQSRGASRQDTLIQISKHVKPQGMVIVTIPNGYLVNGTEVRKGLYDHKTKSFFRRRPNEMANKVEAKLQDYGFSETGIQTIETEMLVWGIKGVEK